MPLSPTEFKLLRYLMVNAGRVLSKAQILDHVWEYDFAGESAIVESYISYLRRKIDTVRARRCCTPCAASATCCASRTGRDMAGLGVASPGRFSLRTRLVVAVLLILTVALAVAGAAASTLLRGYLAGRVDDEMVCRCRARCSGGC